MMDVNVLLVLAFGLAAVSILIPAIIMWPTSRGRQRADVPDQTSEMSSDEIKANIEKLHYTEQLMKLIELLIQRSTVFHFYQQLGKLPLENFTAAMQESMIAAIARDTYESLELEALASKSVLSADYLHHYIIDSTIVAVDCTLTDLIDGNTKLPAVIKDRQKGDA